MRSEETDLGLSAMLSVGKQVAPKLPEELLRRAYAIQKARQFDRDRSDSMEQMQRLINDYVDGLDAGGEAGE